MKLTIFILFQMKKIKFVSFTNIVYFYNIQRCFPRDIIQCTSHVMEATLVL